MLKLKATRKIPKAGYIFVFQLRSEGLFRFGCIVNADAVIGGFEKMFLIYIFSETSSSKADVPVLKGGSLMLPPIGTNRQCWLSGFFETITNVELQDLNVLRQHHFVDFTGRFYDEKGREVAKPIEPVGEWGVSSLRSIDNLICKKLGIKPPVDIPDKYKKALDAGKAKKITKTVSFKVFQDYCMISEIPGVIANPNLMFLYVEAENDREFEQAFDRFGRSDFGKEPESGGIMDEETRIIIPNGKRFYGVSYAGDLDGWLSNLRGYCQKYDRLRGKINQDTFVLCTDERLQLDACEVVVNYKKNYQKRR